MLTAVQHKTYQFIKDYVNKNGYSPTTAEIAAGINIKSRGVVYRYLQALAEKGKIKLIPNRRRNIEVLAPLLTKGLPLIGKIAAGSPIEAIVQQEIIDFTEVLQGNNRFALKVKGDSMVDEGIFDGDIVVCEKTQQASNGQIVVALIDNENATLKRLQFNKDGTLTLIPANPKHQAMVYPNDRIQIQAIFVGLLRIHR